ncbi:hypothetical protein [Luteolibacter luteus]|uniref:DUF4034 domain-containing protein n=1 Tax=Luteolibacter luteus TaxID=2728835 RepID=A0A858RIM4_9BACT|nr:hypothetical protein [Luteolibacter luteus]QJE96767.1 hypothetical protein HHL09_13565 [Luteolibacter luteus]
MNPTRQILSFLAVFAASSVCGAWLADRKTASSSNEAVEGVRSAKPTKSSERQGSGKELPPEVVKRLEEVRRAGVIQDKLRATIHLAQSLPISELEAWFEGKWFDEKEDMLSAVFHRIALSRWLAADPAGLMRYCQSKDESRAPIVAWEWALRDPKSALAYLGEARDEKARGDMASLMGMALAAEQPEAVIAEMPALLGMLKTSDLWAMMAKLAETAPEALKAASANWPPYTREGIARELATVGLKKDFAGTLEQLRNAENGRTIFLNAFPFHSEALAEVIRNPGMLPPGWFGDIATMAGSLLVKDDPGHWLDADLTAMGLDPAQAKQVRSQAIEEIGLKDQARFLSLLDEDDRDPFARRGIIQSTVARMAEDRSKAEAWIDGLPNDEDKESARQMLGSMLNQPKGDSVTPVNLLDGLAKDTGLLTAEQARATGLWSAPELKEATGRFNSMPLEQKAIAARNLLNHSHENFPPELQAQAVSFFTANRSIEPVLADRLFGKRTFAQSACYLAASWAQEDPAAAGKWVSSLPEGEERLWAGKNLASLWSENDPPAVRQWLSGLPEGDRKGIEDYLKSGDGGLR